VSRFIVGGVASACDPAPHTSTRMFKRGATRWTSCGGARRRTESRQSNAANSPASSARTLTRDRHGPHSRACRSRDRLTLFRSLLPPRRLCRYSARHAIVGSLSRDTRMRPRMASLFRSVPAIATHLSFGECASALLARRTDGIVPPRLVLNRATTPRPSGVFRQSQCNLYQRPILKQQTSP
jgi:hypothetical protein